MTKQEYEEWWLRDKGNTTMTLSELHSYGIEAVPCNCDDNDCKGWRMEHYSVRNSA
jgi:hypothetical protein